MHECGAESHFPMSALLTLLKKRVTLQVSRDATFFLANTDRCFVTARVFTLCLLLAVCISFNMTWSSSIVSNSKQPEVSHIIFWSHRHLCTAYLINITIKAVVFVQQFKNYIISCAHCTNLVDFNSRR